MHDQKASKRLKLFAILFAAALAFLPYVQKVVTATQDRTPRLFEILGMSEPLEKRFGSDDGAAFVVHFAGDTRGSLDTCG